MRIAIILLVLISCAASLHAQVPNDVPRDHWAYDSVQYLISKGYITGYPNNSFLGDRSMTRYEFATLTKRILDELNARIQASGTDKVGAEELAQATKLMDEFKIELTVIGTRMDNVEATVTALRQQVEKLNTTVTETKCAVQATTADVEKLKKITLSGYVQARFSAPEGNFNDPTKAGIDEFQVRRARLKTVAKPTAKSLGALQLELGGNASTAIDSKGKPVTVTQVIVKEAYAGYALTGNPATGTLFAFGQMNWPFGYELPLSSSLLETGERALVIQRLFPGEYDRGAAAFGPTGPRFNWTIGAFNGTGANNADKNDAKDLIVNLKYRMGALNLGLAGYRGRGLTNTNSAFLDEPKLRYGANAQFIRDRLALKAEWVRGKGVEGQSAVFDRGQWINGYYALGDYSLMKNLTFVAKYESMTEDPLYPQFERRSAWSLGLIRQQDERTQLKFFYQINQEDQSAFDNNESRFEWLTVF